VRRLATLGGAFILVADGVYLFAISQQGATDNTLRVPFVAVFLAVCGLLALLGADTSQPRLQLALMSFSATGTLIFGVLGIFSIGLLLILAAIPLVIAVVRQRAARPPGLAIVLAAACAALAVTVVGLQETSYPVSCPSRGEMYGSGTGFLTGGYTYSCVNGKLTIGPSPANPNSGSSPIESSGP
jgi:hypothetical protein